MCFMDPGCFTDPAVQTTSSEPRHEAARHYCSAKVNSCGTLPAIGYVGQSSAKAASGFTLSAWNIRAGKSGLLVYTSAGQASLPFGGGILCLAAPRKRSVPLLDTSGTPSLCDGTLSLDMNAFAQGALGGNPASFLLAPRTRVNVQFWARDTPGNVTLSDALEYWVNP